MMTVNEVRKLTGVSVRTLQYYDKIGLLKATAHTEAGYRLYDTSALERLQQILLFRELEFPLKDIQAILQSPAFDRRKALQQQLELLQLKKEHIEGLITLARALTEGDNTMTFTPFSREKQEAYTQQAKASWGKTDAWQEFEEQHGGRSQEENRLLGEGLMEIFAQLGQLRHHSPDASQVQSLIARLQDYITTHYYRCTDQILLGLGQMYAAGGEFTANIDAAGGEGTAVFAAEAIAIHCRR